jgi:superfamily II DNA or RNA helicase
LPTLFPDQEQAIANVRASFAKGKRRPLLVAPCAFGKTFCFSYVSLGTFKNGKRVVILAHRQELLDQISAALIQWKVPHGLLIGGQVGLPRANVVVASVPTLAKRLKHFPAPDLIVVDECHHCSVDGLYHRIISHYPNARVLGVTATPCRLDGQGLGEIFDDIIMGPSVAELIALGRLTPPEVYAPSIPNLTGVHRRGGDYVNKELEAVMDKPSITGHAVAHYKKLAYGKRAIAFCVSVKHAEDVAADFRAAGFRASHVEGKMKKDERKRIIADFRDGKIDVLTSADLIAEGFDVPLVEVGILLRPTQSLSLYIQQVGRVLRLAPGKTRATIIDHAGNTLRHGFIDQPREWSLAGAAEPKGTSESVPRVRTCPVCFACHKPAPICPKCSHVYEVAGREVEHVDGDLVQISKASDYKDDAKGASEFERLYYILLNVGKQRGYESPETWAFNVVSQKLAAERAKERGSQDGTINGLMPDELDDLRSRTIDRERVMKAMSKEEPVTA